MILLFDENLSESLCDLVEDIFPGALHVRRCDLQGASDLAVWDFAIENQLVIVSKDSDFTEKALIAQPSLKVVWIRLGNCSTANVHLLLRNKADAIYEFNSSGDIVLEIP